MTEQLNSKGDSMNGKQVEPGTVTCEDVMSHGGKWDA